jgi:hypothetical protein
MTLLLVSVVLMIAFVAWGVDPRALAAQKRMEEAERQALLAQIRGHGKALKDHGKGLQEEVQGAKKCPKCGHSLG